MRSTHLRYFVRQRKRKGASPVVAAPWSDSFRHHDRLGDAAARGVHVPDSCKEGPRGTSLSLFQVRYRAFVPSTEGGFAGGALCPRRPVRPCPLWPSSRSTRTAMEVQGGRAPRSRWRDRVSDRDPVTWPSVWTALPHLPMDRAMAGTACTRTLVKAFLFLRTKQTSSAHPAALTRSPLLKHWLCRRGCPKSIRNRPPRKTHACTSAHTSSPPLPPTASASPTRTQAPHLGLHR